MLFEKTETNTGSIGPFFSYKQVMLCYMNQAWGYIFENAIEMH